MDKLPLLLVAAALILFVISTILEKANLPLRLAYAGAACFTAYIFFGGIIH